MSYFSTRTRWSSALAAAALSLPLALSACGDDKESVAEAHRELVVGIGQFPQGFHPNLVSHVSQSLIMGAARRPFSAYNADWQLVCMLCTSLPSVDAGTARPWISPDGAEGWELDFDIREDAMWADGTPITTRDVLFTWEVGRHAESGVTNQELYDRIERIEVHDDYRFTIFNNKRTCDYQGLNDFQLVPAHIEEANFSEPREYRNRSAFETDTINPGLYSGPYMITAVELGASVTLERNPNWWGEAPHFDRVIFKAIENTAALEANLLSGDIDYIAGENGVTLDQAITFETQHGEDYQVVFKSGLIYEHIDVNQATPMVADVRVRRALMHGTDREAISARLFDGRQPVADGSVNPLDKMFYDGAPKYEFDPAKAAALLDEAGWSELRDGVRYNAAGEPLVMEILTTSGNRVRETVQQALQSMWADIGVDLRIHNEPARVMFGETVPQRTYSHLAMYAWFSAPDNIPRTTLHSEMIPTEENNFSGQNYPGYASAEMDETLDRLELECGEAAQTELWRRLQTLYATDLPALPLYFRANAYIMPHWLKGLVPTGHQDFSTLWIEDWYVE